jgi:isocitrate lyase
MTAYASLQENEFALAQEHGYGAVRHQRFVGTGYFDAVQQTISGGNASTTAMEGSTETAQFSMPPAVKLNGRAASMSAADACD